MRPMTESRATSLIQSLAGEFGYQAVVDALIEEVQRVPGEELGVIRTLVDAVMADLLARSEGEKA